MTHDELELCSEVNELLSENKRLKDRIKELEATQPKWISVKDKLPPIKTEILVCHRDGKTTGAYYYAHYEKMSDCLTHWMPLPPTPTTESED